MHAQDLVGLLCANDFDEAIGLSHRTGATAGHEREASYAVAGPSSLQGLLCRARPSNFGPGVNHPWDMRVIDMRFLSGDELCYGDTLFRRLMRQHGAARNVSDGVDTGQIRASLAVGFHKSAFIKREANFLCA